jgi:hypothetical protein
MQQLSRNRCREQLCSCSVCVRPRRVATGIQPIAHACDACHQPPGCARVQFQSAARRNETRVSSVHTPSLTHLRLGKHDRGFPTRCRPHSRCLRCGASLVSLINLTSSCSVSAIRSSIRPIHITFTSPHSTPTFWTIKLHIGTLPHAFGLRCPDWKSGWLHVASTIHDS